MSGKQDTIKQAASTMFTPWKDAIQVWISESEKIQQAAMDSAGKALEDSHRLCREGLDMVASLNSGIRNQVSAQMENATTILSK